ncbi:MAG: hypothetical protein JRJ48_03725 [Deltaproteobacteria bacterium]|nr:hypothetical protein [Deltaproteobacteria bacterium]
MSASLQKDPSPVTLNTYAEKRFLPLILAVVENGSGALGAQKAEALRLVLSSEEIFSHLSSILPPKTPLRLNVSSALFYDQVEMAVPVEDIDLRALNLTAGLSPERESDLEEMGLLIAARSVDFLHVERGDDGGMVFRIIKERNYPKADTIPELRLPKKGEALEVREGTPQTLKNFSYLLLQHYAAERFPESFGYPGKLVDMVKSGVYGALIAEDSHGAIGGGVVWRVLNPRMVECFGPYVFIEHDREPLIRALLDGVVGKIARTSVLGLINRYNPVEMPPGYFEELGTVKDYSQSPEGKEYPYFYRLLEEDLGSKVWASSEIESFLTETYQHLVLPREIITIHDVGEHHPDHSVISAEFEHPQKRVRLRPLWLGKDMAENLSRHVAAFGKEGIANILFELDLGVSEHALWIPALMGQHFTPRVVLPYAGKGDLVIFQYDAPAT